MPKGDTLIIMLEKFFCSLRKSDVGAPAQLERFWVMHRRSQENRRKNRRKKLQDSIPDGSTHNV